MLKNGHYELISHNYMRSLWALLILMAICSFVAQRRWAAIFNNDSLRAILKLPGSEDMALVKRTQEARPYEILMQLGGAKRPSQKTCSQVGLISCIETIEILIGDENMHSRTLDYHPNQLIYLLLSSRTSAYRLSGLKLKRQIILYSIYSFLLTSAQFLLPLFFIGDKYALYGFNFLKAWLNYATNSLLQSSGSNINSVDYELSARIWPTMTQCKYMQYGLQGHEYATVQCTVPINEICAKLFVVIWWFVVINIIIELASLCSILACSISFTTTKWTFGRRFWPRVRKQAETIVSFRYRNALLRRRLYNDPVGEASCLGEESGARLAAVGEEDIKRAKLSEREKKKLEAEEGRFSAEASLDSKKWYLWCTRDLGMVLACQCRKLANKGRRGRIEVEDGFKEYKEDSNILFLLYLLYLRTGCSRKRTETIIRMTGNALANYLEALGKQAAEPGEGLLDTNEGQCDTRGQSSEASETGTILEVMM